MEFEFSEKVKSLMDRVQRFMDDHIYPIEPDYYRLVREAGGWDSPPILDELKVKAKEPVSYTHLTLPTMS